MTIVVTEDNVTLNLGDHAYDYYTMKPGTITPDERFIHAYETQDQAINPKRDIWFKFDHDDGTSTQLNGERICSDEFARRRGFPNA